MSGTTKPSACAGPMLSICSASATVGRRGLDQGADIAPDHGHVAILRQIPADDAVDPQFEQDERHDDRIKIDRLETAVPDPAHRVGRDRNRRPGAMTASSAVVPIIALTRSSSVAALRVSARARNRPIPPTPCPLCLAAPEPEPFPHPVIPGWCEGPDPESRIPGSPLRAPRNDGRHICLNPACGGSASRRSSSPAASGPSAQSRRTADSPASRPSA